MNGEQLNVRIQQAESAKINRLTEITGMTKPALIRWLIREAAETVKSPSFLKGASGDD